MKDKIRQIIFQVSVVFMVLGSWSSSQAQALELDTFYTDSFCVAAPRPLPSDTISWDEERTACIEMLQALALEKAKKAWRDSVAIIVAEHINKQKCFKTGFDETFNVTHETTEHHYTLYYYDLAGNLVQTVPPEGVNPLDNNAFPEGVWNEEDPVHDTVHITRYQYNSVGQVIIQSTADADTTEFFYDRAQRLRFSQNSKQRPVRDYAYTMYDGQGRIVQVGELKGQAVTETQIHDQEFPGDSPSRIDTVITTYDHVDAPPIIPSSNTRARVAKVHNGHTESYYDYDAHGNVRELTQIVPRLYDDTITMEYDYDLISGNVNEFRYEPDGELDRLTQRYMYDADNRIQSAYSSDDGYVFEEDARYFYYLHGPLARVEYGEDKVQGLDYFYTLQGWIKGMNMPGQVGLEGEPGRDGTISLLTHPNRFIGRDATQYSLGYNEQDYLPIAGNNILSDAITDIWGSLGDEVLGNNIRGLFNGNITHMLTDNSKGLQGMAYQYDALHRIKYANSIKWENNWTTLGEYQEPDINYDANGNIKSFERHSPGLEDALAYYYDDEYPNRLDYIDGDSEVANLMPQSAGNYTYDRIGNIIADASEGTNMTWDVYGKLRTVTGTEDTPISYTYDTQGNRLYKRLGAQDITDVYVRDASGNIIAIYEHRTPMDSFIDRIKEFNLYGSSRLGALRPNRIIYHTDLSRIDTLTPLSSRVLKYYEFSNHLGNVLTTVWDRKLGQDNFNDGFAEFYIADTNSAADYYPFGLEMPGRGLASAASTFGFNGKEKDGSISSVTHYDYGFRIYNPGIGRFLSVDPLTKEYPWYTPYQFAGNMPIKFIDLDGLEPENNPKSPENQSGYNPTKTIKQIFRWSGGFERFKTNSEKFYASGTYIQPSGPTDTYFTDTELQTAKTENIFVGNSGKFMLNDVKFTGEEVTNVVLGMMISGQGYENIEFPTNGHVSKQMMGSPIVTRAVNEFKRLNSAYLASGEIDKVTPLSKKVDFNAADTYLAVQHYGTIFSIPGFVGSAKITITVANENEIMVNIFNISSITSGDLTKHFRSKDNPKSVVRDGYKLTRWNNISQTYSGTIPIERLKSNKSRT